MGFDKKAGPAPSVTSVEATLPLEPWSVERALKQIDRLLLRCDMVSKVRWVSRARLWVRFLPRHFGLRIPHSYTFNVEPTPGGLRLSGRAFLMALTISIETRPEEGGTRVRITALCSGNPLLRRIARPEVHRFLGQLLESIYEHARRMGGGSERSPAITVQQTSGSSSPPS